MLDGFKMKNSVKASEFYFYIRTTPFGNRSTHPKWELVLRPCIATGLPVHGVRGGSYSVTLSR